MSLQQLREQDDERLAQRISTAQMRLSDTLSEIKIPEALAGFGLVFFGVSLPGIPFPIAYLGLMLLPGLALLRRPTNGFGELWWLGPALAVLLAYAAGVSFIQLGVDGTWLRRWIRLVIVIGCLMMFIGGRIHIPSVLRGLGVGLVVNFVGFYAGVAPNTYGGVLTGWFVDKNQAGVGYVVYGVLLLQILRRNSHRVLAYFAVGGAVWLTGSRTAIAAWLGAGLWMVVSPRLGVFTRYLSAVAIAAMVYVMESQFARVGQFANREGSDMFRERIAEATTIKLASASAFGEGLGGAFVHLDARRWFFHSSYHTLLYEGGWFYLVGVVAITAIIALRPLGSRRSSSDAVAVEGAAAALLICAWKLGEVFLTPVWLILMASAVWHYMIDSERQQGRTGLPIPVHVRRQAEHQAVLDQLHGSRR